LALEYLLGEDFLFYHLFKATELIEELYTSFEDEERKRMALIPILKAAYIYRRDTLVGIQERNVEELNSKMERYQIDQEEIKELEERLDDPSDPEDTPDKMYENLLHLSIMIISRDLRRNIFTGETKQFKDYSRTILSILQAINYLGDKCDNDYYHFVRLAVKRLLRTDDLFKRKKQALLLENFAQHSIFQGETEPTQSELEELLYNFDFFEIPLTNKFIELGTSFIQNIKTVMEKIPVEDEEFPFLTGQFINMFLKEQHLPPEDEEHLNLIYVATLIAVKGIPFKMTQTMLVAFIQTKAPEQSETQTNTES
jgi:hypothetical protein